MTTPEADYITFPERPPWDGFDRAAWIACGVMCALIIAVEDRSLPGALLWVTGSVVRGERFLSRLFANAQKWPMMRHLPIAAATGWALIPGPPVGSLAGVLAPIIWNLPITSFRGGVIGLFAGPLVSGLLGVTVASLVLGGGRLYAAVAEVSWEKIDPGRQTGA